MHPKTRDIVGGGRVIDLHGEAGPALAALPYSFRILLEAALRDGRSGDAAHILAWPADRQGGAEIAFTPRRVLMHDTTAVPAIADLAAMRDVVARAGGDPRALDPVCPVAVSVDHSLNVARFGTPDAMRFNTSREIALNRERYAFLKWAGQAFDGLRVFPAGSGILHTINLEHLATVMAPVEGGLIAPDVMIGTDSHTPMINALGVLGWGVGGLEAESAMLGAPLMLALPQVVGVRLVGRLPEGLLGTDLALHVTAELRALGVVGRFVEFFGPGVAALSVGERAAVANMAPEYGATTGFFPIDAATLRYLRATGRDAGHVAQVEAAANALGLWAEPGEAPSYTEVLEIDLSALRPIAAGPRRPHDRKPLAVIARDPGAGQDGVPQGAVGIAAITSCTNTADLRMLVTAALLARNANARGLQVPPWVKTSFAPGSAAMLNALRDAGLQADLDAAGFNAVGIGCTTCIGNSGPLAPAMAAALDADPELARAAILSGNRNFPGRVHPQLPDGYLVSPPLVVAFAFAGRLIDMEAEALGRDPAGVPVHLADIWPDPATVEAMVARAADPEHTLAAYRDLHGSAAWRGIAAASGPRYPWEDGSAYLRPPAFVGSGVPAWPSGTTRLGPVAVYGDDVTTDAISPAGAVPKDSAAADYLRGLGVAEGDLNVYAAFRGNFEVMRRGAFTAPALVNLLAPEGPANLTRLAPGAAPRPLVDAAREVSGAGGLPVLIAGARYGQGSSRDWAAKAPKLIGLRAILAAGFERIHRSNLIGMGIAPVILPDGWHPATMDIRPGDDFEIALPARPAVHAALPLRHLRAGRVLAEGTAQLACITGAECETLLAGGIIPQVLHRALGRIKTPKERTV